MRIWYRPAPSPFMLRVKQNIHTIDLEGVTRIEPSFHNSRPPSKKKLKEKSIPDIFLSSLFRSKHTNKTQKPFTSWWLNQPICKICSSNWKSCPIFGVNIFFFLPPPSYDIPSWESLPIHGWLIFMEGKYTPPNWWYTDHHFLHTSPPSPTDCSSIDCLTYHWIVVPPHWVDRCVSEDRRQDHDLKQQEVKGAAVRV